MIDDPKAEASQRKGIQIDFEKFRLLHNINVKLVSAH